MADTQIYVGIDEVGRGPVAGPVAVGVFVSYDGRQPEYLRGIKDSKKLSEGKRDEWFKILKKLKKDGKCNYAVRFCTAEKVDIYGINGTIKYAMKKALKALDVDPSNAQVLLDGSLHAPRGFIHQETIIKGDMKECIIGAASIVAKVTRDRRMINLAKKFPIYGFENNKGYGTKEHMLAIRRNSVCKEHRLTFLNI